jgi:hypothetical protein
MVRVMDFEQRLQQAIERGQRRSETRQAEAQKIELTEEEFKRLHSQYRLSFSERIEACMHRLPNHFPGFQYETMFGDRGWGAACFREDLRLSRGTRSRDYSRLELTVRPYSATLHVLEIAAKGTVRNKEVFTRTYYEPLQNLDNEKFLQLIDLWILEYAELYASAE